MSAFGLIPETVRAMDVTDTSAAAYRLVRDPARVFHPPVYVTWGIHGADYVTRRIPLGAPDRPLHGLQSHKQPAEG